MCKYSKKNNDRIVFGKKTMISLVFTWFFVTFAETKAEKELSIYDKQ